MTVALPYVILIFSGVTEPAILLVVVFIVAGAAICGILSGLVAYALRNKVPKILQLLIACLIFIMLSTAYLMRKSEVLQKSNWVDTVITSQYQLSNPKHTINNVEVVLDDSRESAEVTITFSGQDAGAYTLEYFVTDERLGEPYEQGTQRLDLPAGISSQSVQIDNTAVVTEYAAAALTVPLSQAQIAVDEDFVFKVRLLPIIDQELPVETVKAAHSSVSFVSFEYPMMFQITNGKINYMFEGFNLGGQSKSALSQEYDAPTE